MSLNSTPQNERIHISFFGKRNVGKSSLFNAFLGQNVSIVSEKKGTTTDPVSKAMELLPLGPVMLTDTAGLDDEGEIGNLRIEKAKTVLRKTDIAVLVFDDAPEKNLLSLIKEREIPCVLVKNKIDLMPTPEKKDGIVYVSAKTGEGIEELKNAIIKIYGGKKEKPLVSDLLNKGDKVLLVIPIDSSAPKGRLILPQQQILRDILDCGAVSLICGVENIENTLSSLNTPPRLCICDSQVFGTVANKIPKDLPLTSFSIILARYKGNLSLMAKSAKTIKNLMDGDKVLIAEGCTHHRQCEDIGTVKIPMLIKKKTGVNPDFHFVSGGDFPDDLSDFKLIIHCGGCMLNQKEISYRLNKSAEQNIPITNYGTLLAHLNGILERAIAPFPDLK